MELAPVGIGGLRMNNVAYAMKMPTNYVEMTSTDLEYDGGWSWNKIFYTAAIVGAVVAGIGAVIMTGGAAAFLAAGVATTSTAASTAIGVGLALFCSGSVVAMGSVGGCMLTSD